MWLSAITSLIVCALFGYCKGLRPRWWVWGFRFGLPPDAWAALGMVLCAAAVLFWAGARPGVLFLPALARWMLAVALGGACSYVDSMAASSGALASGRKIIVHGPETARAPECHMLAQWLQAMPADQFAAMMGRRSSRDATFVVEGILTPAQAILVWNVAMGDDPKMLDALLPGGALEVTPEQDVALSEHLPDFGESPLLVILTSRFAEAQRAAEKEPTS